MIFGFGQEINASGVMSDLTREKKQIHFGMQQRMNITWLGKLLWAGTCTGTDLLTVSTYSWAVFKLSHQRVLVKPETALVSGLRLKSVRRSSNSAGGRKGRSCLVHARLGSRVEWPCHFNICLAQRRLQFP